VTNALGKISKNSGYERKTGVEEDYFTNPADIKASTYAAPRPLLPRSSYELMYLSALGLWRRFTSSYNHTFPFQTLQIGLDAAIHGADVFVRNCHFYNLSRYAISVELFPRKCICFATFDI
jgi:hypothetical protein